MSTSKVECPGCKQQVTIDPRNPICPNCFMSLQPQGTPPPPTPPSPTPPPPTGIGKLYLITKDNQRLILEEVRDAEVILGRARLAQYARRNPETISEPQCKFSKEGGVYYVRDDKPSKNGTYIEGQDIRAKGKIALKDGTQLNLVNPTEPVVVIEFKIE